MPAKGIRRSDDAPLHAFRHLNYGNRPTAPVYADASRDGESRQRVAVASGPGRCGRQSHLFLARIRRAPGPRLKRSPLKGSSTAPSLGSSINAGEAISLCTNHKAKLTGVNLLRVN